MGLFSFITGAKQVDKCLDIGDKVSTGIMAGIDKAFYTKEEKAINANKIMDAQLEFFKTTMSESTIRSVTRRVIAIMIMALFSFAFLFTVLVWKYDPGWAEHCIKTVKTFSIGELTFMVGVFFFGSHALASFVKRK